MKINFKKKNRKSGRPGFVVLFTVLIASVVLAMALGIANIALKQIVLTASATDANKSFYAADTGVECALYHDLKLTTAFEPGWNGAISCGVMTLLPVVQSPPGSDYFTFLLDIPSSSGDSCANVSVDKTVPSITVITSRGTNNMCGFSNARTVERVIEVTY